MIYPKEIIVETTNKCNIRCLFCHFHGKGAIRKRPIGYMKEHTWKKILTDISSWSNQTSGIAVCFHGAGEPLLHPQLKEILELARSIPKASIGFMTNGMLLNKDWSEFITDLPLDWLWLSIDGVKPETNDYFRRGAKLSIIERNLFQLLEIKDKKKASFPVLNFNMVAYPGVPEEECSMFVNKWMPYAQVVAISRFRPIPSKKLMSITERESLKYKPCPMLYKQMVIAWNGLVGLCCEDINLEVVVGDSNKHSLIEIYNNKIMNKIRRLHESGEKHKIELCKECDVWASDEIFKEKREIISDVQVRITYRPSGIVYEKIN